MRRCLLVVVLAVLLLPTAALAKSPIRPVLLDTDIGYYLDDALALAVLLANPDIDLKAITTSGGDCEDRAWIVCRMLTMVGRKEIPVAWGRDPQPKGEVLEMYQYRYHPAVLFNRTAKPQADKDAAELLYEKLKESPKGETTLLAIGPLTNVARLLEKHPDSKEMLRRIVVMGGQIRRGKDGREAEWNFAQDIKAAQAVLASGAPITLIPVDAADHVSAQPLQSLFASQTLLTQQLQALHQLTGGDPADRDYGLYDAIAAAVVVDDTFGTRNETKISIDDEGITRNPAGEPNVELVTIVDGKHFHRLFGRIADFGNKAQPHRPTNFSILIERGGLPARVHAFEDYETDIEKRWWLVGRLFSGNTRNLGERDASEDNQRAMQSVLTLDFDDLQGNLKSMYSAVVFNPVPGPPMGPKTRLSFRYQLRGADQLRVQLYSLSNGYHRYLALKDLPQNKWQQATVDMTDMRRPDGSGGLLAEDERIDDIQFYVAPTARVSVDDIVLYDAAPDGEQQPFPKRLIFTGWFDTGKQGEEWPGDYEIVELEKPRKWKAAKSVMNKELAQPWLRVSFRGERPIGETTAARFKCRLTGGESFTMDLANSKAKQSVSQQVAVKPDEWTEQTLQFSAAEGMSSADEMRFVLPAGAELLVDDLLVYER